MTVAAAAQGHEQAGATGRAHASLRWAADYLMACHTAPDEFVGQVRSLCCQPGSGLRGACLTGSEVHACRQPKRDESY